MYADEVSAKLFPSGELGLALSVSEVATVVGGMGGIFTEEQVR